MEIKKRKVVAKIDCGEENCGPCDFLSDMGWCNLYNKNIEIENEFSNEEKFLRCKKCLKAEKELKNGN